MYEIQADMQLAYEGEVWAYGMVTLNHSIRFPVQLRKYKDKGTGEERTFLSLPRKKQNEKWMNLVHLDKGLEEEILCAVGAAVKEKLCAELLVPEVDVLSVHSVKPQILPGAKAYICGVASIKVCGITILGITVKQGMKGLFVNMPQYKTETGYHDVVYGITKEMQKKIKDAVLEKYQKECCVPKSGTERSQNE